MYAIHHRVVLNSQGTDGAKHLGTSHLIKAILQDMKGSDSRSQRHQSYFEVPLGKSLVHQPALFTSVVRHTDRHLFRAA